MVEATPILDAKASLAEGPVWDGKRHLLWWVNIPEGEVHAFDPGARTDKVIRLHEPIGVVVLRAGGGLVAGLKSGFAFVDSETGERTPILDPEPDRPDDRFNDGKCDPAGRFWAGTITGKKGEASLYCLDPDLSVRKMAEAITISNGLDWSPDNRVFYYVDTPTQQVVAYDYDIGTGAISNKRVAVEIPKEEGSPDGMSIDREGMLWIAMWDGWQVARFDPKIGKKIESIKMPVARPSSCCFGGPDLNHLYITSARAGFKEADLEKQPLAGGIFRADLNVPGVAAVEFKG
ncbi:SMP-30/gluconolactonase/LRE family protein [bacterium]|nr:SMP-30/gluconolactonase/LRE family protein [bacterium]